ncbi:hypothetical protein DFH09DRAFT_1364769 [Mycena vulgaris]|nr:hypothetical protein DFH09DRAFT_1364769 [Mycena vulgaris]
MSTLIARAEGESGYALAKAEYARDFMPTRDRTVINGELFTFKSCAQEHLATDRRRGCLQEYRATVFGEVDCYLEISRIRTVVVRLKCPDGVSCAARTLYREQLGVMRRILEFERADLGSTIDRSWFQSEYDFGDEPAAAGECFYVTIVSESLFSFVWLRQFLEIGDNIELPVSLRRVDEECPDTGAVHSGYELRGRECKLLDDHDLPPRKAIGYACDLARTGKFEYKTDKVVPCVPRRKPRLASHYMVFSGCVIAVVPKYLAHAAPCLVALGLPPSPNETAIRLDAIQQTYLREIAVADMKETDTPCTVLWGDPALEESVPTVIIDMWRPSTDHRMQGTRGRYPIAVGDDITTVVRMNRVDTEAADGSLCLRYNLDGHLYAKLAAIFVGMVAVLYCLWLWSISVIVPLSFSLRLSLAIAPRHFSVNMAVPSTDDQITNVYLGLRAREPHFPGFAYGYLYATASTKRRVVAVPYNFGVKRITSVNDLFTHVWVPSQAAPRNVVDLAIGRVLVTHFPADSTTPLEFPYTIFFRPRNTVFPGQKNACGSIRAAADWYENVLVVKHGKRKAVINVDREDAMLVDAIVNTFISENQLQCHPPQLRSLSACDVMVGQAQKKRKGVKQQAYEREGKRQKRRQVLQTILASEFFHTPELLLTQLLYHVDVITLFALAHTGRYARGIVKAFVACNLRLLVERFLGRDNVDTFYVVLEESGSAMAGSLVSSVLTAPYRHAWTPSNFNIFVPNGFLFRWYQFFATVGFTEKENGPGVDSKFAHTTSNHVVFHSAMADFTIELSESIDSSVFTPLTGFTNTFSASLASCADLYTFYVEQIAQHRSVEGWFPTPVKKAVALNRRKIRNSFSTTSWSKPCGLACPVLKRQVRGLDGVGAFRWGGASNQHADGDANVRVPNDNTDIQWQLGDRCTNRKCPWNGASYNGFM